MNAKQLFTHLVKLGKAYQAQGTSVVYQVILTECSLRGVAGVNVERMAAIAWVKSAQSI